MTARSNKTHWLVDQKFVMNERFWKVAGIDLVVSHVYNKYLPSFDGFEKIIQFNWVHLEIKKSDELLDENILNEELRDQFWSWFESLGKSLKRNSIKSMSTKNFREKESKSFLTGAYWCFRKKDIIKVSVTIGSLLFESIFLCLSYLFGEFTFM